MQEQWQFPAEIRAIFPIYSNLCHIDIDIVAEMQELYINFPDVGKVFFVVFGKEART